MKKTIYLLLILAIAIGMTGCGTNKQTANEVTNNQAIEKNLNLPYPSPARANARMMKHDYKGAIEDCNALIQKTPNDPMLYTQRGIVEIRTRDYDSAIADFDKTLQIKPDFKMAIYEKQKALDLKSRR